jgi:hypothetical protein
MRPFDDDDMPVGSDEYSDVALMMAAVREWPSEEFARDLDARVARRFAPLASASDDQALRASRGRRWLSLPALGGVGGLVVAGVVAGVVIATSGGGTSGALDGPSYNVSKPLSPELSLPKAGARAGVTGVVVHPSANHAAATTPTKISALAGAGIAGGVATSSAGVPTQYGPQNLVQSGAAVPAPAPGTGAKQIESAQISLNAANDHIDQVSQEVFNVVSDEHGSVGSSKITAATSNSGGGYAFFTLSIPTSNLQAAMTQLSRLRYATVGSRTDATQNVGGQYSRDQRQLRDAQALRVSLLKQLQTADSETAIDSIEAQIKTAERQISSGQATLHSLQHSIGYSKVSVEINSVERRVFPVAHKSSGFTIKRAGHDAVRVLIVSAGVALIALAVLIPIGLLGALIGWSGAIMRQRRRERALDAG